MSRRRAPDPTRLPFECALAARRIAALPTFVRWVQIQDGYKPYADFELSVELPIASQPLGVTPKGVFRAETVRIEFPHGFPVTAPRLTLRGDFPHNLAHIQPRFRAGRVEPCLSPQRAQEAYATVGLDGTLNSLEEWLHRAAADNLVNPAQGWEPTRRDSLGDEIITDISALRVRASGTDAVALRANFQSTRLWNGEDYEAGFFQLTGAEQTTAIIGMKSLEGLMQPGRHVGATLCLLIPCARDAAGETIVYTDFFGGPVGGLGGLIGEAARIGVDDTLRAMLDSVSCLWSRDWIGFPLAVVLAARRPLKLIGSDSDIELLPFICRSAQDGRFDGGADVRVEHARLTEAVTRPLLQKMSGAPVATRPLTMIGVGSLGSKVAMHEVRRGEPPRWLVDSGYYKPHHAARHYLGPAALTSDIDGAAFKAFAIKAQARAYRAEIDAAPFDALHLLQSEGHRSNIFADEQSVVLNTTGSVSVRNGLADATCVNAAGQIVEAGLIGDGSLAMISEEGGARNPNSTDLYLAAMAAMGARSEFSAAFGDISRAAIGEGCSSATLIMSDARVSRFAGMLSDHLAELRARERVFDKGFVHLLRCNGLAVESTTLDYAPFLVVEADGDPVWRIRLDARLAAEIEARSAGAFPAEAGGYLIGRAFEAIRTITVVAIEDAPKGSSASAGQMTLAPRNASGLPEATAGGLEVVGTWHSHTTPSDPSPRDYASARKIAAQDARPRTLLIRHPGGWRAIATRALGGK